MLDGFDATSYYNKPFSEFKESPKEFETFQRR